MRKKETSKKMLLLHYRTTGSPGSKSPASGSGGPAGGSSAAGGAGTAAGAAGAGVVASGDRGTPTGGAQNKQLQNVKDHPSVRINIFQN